MLGWNIADSLIIKILIKIIIKISQETQISELRKLANKENSDED